MRTKKRDKLLFTPGPLTTTLSVKQEMLSDYGSRDYTFIGVIREIREKLLKLAGISKKEGYETVIMQGSGTFGIESVISSAIPADGHLLLLINGAYGERMLKMTVIHNIKTTKITYAENEIPLAADVEKALEKDNTITHVGIVHCETTTGVFNELDEIGEIAKKYDKTYIVDAMSSFGAVPVNFKEADIDYLISSSNKCIEGVPGFSFIIAKKSELEKCNGNSRTLSLDLYNQWAGLESNGQFRFTPPVQAIMAFHRAVEELEEEGGVEARAARYKENNSVMLKGMLEMGFKLYLPQKVAGYIINTFENPESSNYNFKTFYEKLNERGLVIYPGKLTQAECFRIGNIGQLYKDDIKALLAAIREIKEEMNF